MANQDSKYDLAVIGGGSGGIGAALAAARGGLRVVLVEKEDVLGGTSTAAGVSSWEPGVGGTGIAFDIYRRLKTLSNAVAICSSGRHFSWQDDWYWPHALDKVNFPGGETLIDPTLDYIDSLRRHVPPGEVADESFHRRYLHSVIFEPQGFSEAAIAMLRETEHCDLRLSTALTAVTAEQGGIVSGRLANGDTIRARYWIDSTGDAFVCRQAGCDTLRGKEPRSRFGEPSAPEKGDERGVNGVTLIYRATEGATPQVEPLPNDVPAVCWWADAFPAVKCDHFPNGDLLLNMLPTMSGEEYVGAPSAAYGECARRVRAHWHFLQENFAEFQAYRLQRLAPQLGIRESRRVVCEAMLTEHDIVAGLSRQTHPDIVAIADHPCDRHGGGGGIAHELSEPYGIPYRCLLPKGARNLLVASRCSGFSSIAASSCRLSRTMIQLGQAAGTAVALADEQNLDLPDVPASALSARLLAQHVQLNWPMTPALRTYLNGNNLSD